ncbi:MAG: hypothetical protein ACT4QF_07025 [Sporichthyaceae bacterium]|jgi:hypothetical protein
MSATLQAITALATANVPNPGPIAPPGTEIIVGNWIGYFKWFALVAGTIGLITCGIMMMIGRRHRSALASEGAAGVPWVIAGLILVSLTSTIVATVLPG